MIRARFAILLLVLSALFVAGISTLQAVRQIQLDEVLNQSKLQQSRAAKQIIDLESKGIDALAKDYTYWDDMVNFVKHPTKQFAEENLVTSYKTFDVDAIWIYDVKGKLVWSGTRKGMETIGDPQWGHSPLPQAIGTSKICRFFASTPLGVAEFRAATINRTNDPKRIGPTYGYLVAAMVWDADWMAKIRSIIDSHIELLGPNATTAQIKGASEFDTLDNLTNLDGVPVAKMYISSMNSNVRLLAEGSSSESLWVMGFACIVLVVVSLCLSKWVTRPLTIITRAIQTGNTDLLALVKHSRTEFGRLASVVDASFAQRASLEAQIRHRKRAQIELLKIRKAVDCASDAITIADEHGNVIYINKAYFELFGYTAREVTEMGGFGSLLGEELKTAVRERVLSGQVWNGEAEVGNKSGERIPISWRTTPVTDSHGVIIGMISVIVDVREKQLMQRRIVQSEKLAALGELMAGIAHELNNPLAAISGSAQLLEMNPDPDVQSDAKSIRKMADRAHRIIGSMLTFSRENPIDKRHCELSKPIEAALEMCDYRLRKLGIRLELTLSEKGPWAYVNEQQVQQIVLNLLNNAEHAVRDNDHDDRVIGLWCGTTLAEDGSRRATIRVADNGMGIDPETQQCMFDPFFTTKDVGEGTGLGLSICHRIVADHGGTIEVSSAPGQGTLFEVSFAESVPKEHAA